MDRAESPGAPGGPLYMEVATSFYANEKRPRLRNYIYGLGGRDTTPEDLETVFTENLEEKAPAAEVVSYLGLRE